MLHGNLFNSAIMKTSVISDDFRRRYLSDPTDPTVAHVWALAVAVATGIFFAAFEGRAVVFDGPEIIIGRDRRSLRAQDRRQSPLLGRR